MTIETSTRKQRKVVAVIDRIITLPSGERVKMKCKLYTEKRESRSAELKRGWGHWAHPYRASFVIGGLTRTEHQPSPVSRAPGWRPLH